MTGGQVATSSKRSTERVSLGRLPRRSIHAEVSIRIISLFSALEAAQSVSERRDRRRHRETFTWRRWWAHRRFIPPTNRPNANAAAFCGVTREQRVPRHSRPCRTARACLAPSAGSQRQHQRRRGPARECPQDFGSTLPMHQGSGRIARFPMTPGFARRY